MKENRYTRFSLVVLFTALSCTPTVILAARTATVEVRVTVVESPPCIINGDRIIEVDFGDVIVPRIDGINYTKSVDYTLECKGQLTNIMKMAINGNPVTFDNSALKTNVTDFGIALRANGKPLVINNWINFIYPDKPFLEAVPVKRAGADLPGGEFNAGATMMVLYQ
ncbi:fimbrial protein [Enterobacter bugandensis]|uniref:fimbrial protein n=1 Tax=Enterobacter bugandensis TaxID=881260 RepID=UPI0013D59C4C|nr:fimbrial protein [Enterobacter bugandensis]